MAFNPATANIIGQKKFDISTAAPVADEKMSPSVIARSPIGVLGVKPKESRAVTDLPEFGSGQLMAGQDLGVRAKAALAGQFTPDPQELANILKEISPDIGITQTPEGDLIANNNKTGSQVVINKPGLSMIDIIQGLSLTGAFMSAAASAPIATTTLGRMAVVGGMSSLTQSVIETGQTLSGGEFNVGDVAIVGLGGAGFEGLFQGISRLIPAFRETIKNTGGNVTPEIRETFKHEALKSGGNPDEITDDIILDIINPKGAAIQGEQEFGIPLTRGQRGGTQGQLRREDDILTGRAGDDKTQGIMLDHRETASQRAREAATRLQGELGDSPLVTTQQEAGGIIKQGIQSAEQEMDILVAAARDEIGDATLSPDSFKRLLNKTKSSVRGLEFPTDGKISPSTNQLLKDIKKAKKLYERTPKGVTLKPLHIQRIEQVRRSIGAYIKSAANPTDKRNMVVMKRAYDDFLDDAIKNALFSGDQEALNALKASRLLFSEYAKKFRANPSRTKTGRQIPDKAGNIIEDIIEANPTDVQVVNSIFGAGKTFGNQAGKAITSRMKKILGSDSPEWATIRQAAFKRIIQTFPDGKTINGKATQKFITETVRKNPELLYSIFTKQEVETFKRFASQVSRSQPTIERGMVNPSGSGLVVNEGIKSALSKITEMVGWTTGNPILVIAGKGIQTGKGYAKEATKPFEKIINPKPAPIAAGTASTQNIIDSLKDEDK